MMIVSNGRRLSIACSSLHIGTQTRLSKTELSASSSSQTTQNFVCLPKPPRATSSSSSATQSDVWLLRSHPDGLMTHPKRPRKPPGASEATQSFLCFLRCTHRPLSGSSEATQELLWLLRSHPAGPLTHPKPHRPSSASYKASSNRRLSIACFPLHIGTQTLLSKIEGRRCALPRGHSIIPARRLKSVVESP